MNGAGGGSERWNDDQLPVVYEELRRLAAGYLRRERPNHALQAAALVHEAYLKMAGREGWQDRSHFIATAATLMRRILTDHARHGRAIKRGAGYSELTLDDARVAVQSVRALYGDLDEALNRLARLAPRQAKVVELRFFGGLTEKEVAVDLSLCPRTIKRDWAIAKAWLYGELA